MKKTKKSKLIKKPAKNKFGKCQRCKVKAGTETHTCPYSEEIHNDSTNLCNCCTDCAQECAWDI